MTTSKTNKTTFKSEIDKEVKNITSSNNNTGSVIVSDVKSFSLFNGSQSAQANLTFSLQYLKV